MNAKKAAAMIAIKADSKALDRDLAAAKKKLRTFGDDAKKIGGKLWGAGKGALGKLGNGLGIQAAASITDALSNTMEFEKGLVRMQIAAGKTAGEMAGVRDALNATSRATAVSRDEILAGGQAYLAATGDAAGLVDMMQLLAKTAQASGAKTADLANVAAKLRDNFKIDNAADMERALSGLIQQGKAGSVELSDLAATLAGVAPQFANFGSVGGVAGVGELGAAMQVVSKGFGTAKEAATGLRSMMSALVQNATRFEKAGVRIFDKDPKTGEKRMRNLSEIWRDIDKSKLVKDPKLLSDAFGQQEARRAYDQLRKFPELYDQLIAAGQDYNAVGRDFGQVMDSPVMRAEQAMNNIKLAIAEAFTPERIAAFAAALEKVLSVASDVLGTLGKIGDYWDDTMAEFNNPHEAGSKWQRVAAGALGIDVSNPMNADEDMFRTKMRDITSRGTREEKIREALSASLSQGSGAGQQGVRDAGNEFLGRMPRAQVMRVRGQMEGQAVEGFTQSLASEIASAVKGAMSSVNLTVKMDSSAVAKSVANAPSKRGGQ